MTLRAVLLGATALVTMSVSTSTLAEGPITSPLKVTSVEFTPTPAPANEFEMALPYTRSKAVVTLADGSKKTFPLSYQILHRSGDYVGEWYAGLIVDKGGKPILQSAPDAKGKSRCDHRVYEDGGAGAQRCRQEALHGDQLHSHRDDRRREQGPSARRHQAKRRPQGPRLRSGLRKLDDRRPQGHLR